MRALPFVVIGSIVLAEVVFGQQPSFTKTILYGTGSSGDSIVSIQFVDGLGHTLQTCTYAGSTADQYTLFSGTYYDNAGRPIITEREDQQLCSIHK
jgi:hypothetical protein